MLLGSVVKQGVSRFEKPRQVKTFLKSFAQASYT